MSDYAQRRKRKIYHVTLVGLVVNLFLSVGKLAAGLLGRSGAMVADAVHSFSDMATDIVVLAFARISAKPQDDTHNYGHGKYETLATIIISLALSVVGGGIMIALAFLLDDYTIDPSNFGMNTPVAAFFKTVGSAAFGYMLPILSAFIAMSIADRPGLAVGFAGGVLAMNGTNFAGIAAGETTGGFGANLDMVVEYKPELKGFMTTNAPGILGQGIKMAQAIGADTVDMDQIQIHPTVEANTAALITEGLRGDGAVLINAEGKRFIDEVGTRDVVSAAEIAQTGSYSWLIIDQKMVDDSSVIQGYIKKGYTFEGKTYEELAEQIGVDGAALAETMNTWNGYVEAKNDPDFGRTSFANPLDTAPYYAIKVTAGVHHTMGGLKINTNTEVLNENGEIIPGLFAAGEVTGGVHGANRLGGTAVSDFVVFGRIAGAAASKYAA